MKGRKREARERKRTRKEPRILRPDIIAAHLPRAFFSLSRRDYTIDVSPPPTRAYAHTDGDGKATQARVTRTTCLARRVRSRSDNVSGVFGERRPPSPVDSTREKGTAKRANLSRGDPSRARRGPVSRGWGCHAARARARERRGKTHGPIAESDGEGDEERGMAKGRERGRERREREGTDVYLAFPIPAQRLVSCLLSLSLFFSFVLPPPVFLR